MTELKVAGISVDPASKSPILVLRTVSDLFILPIWIGPSEAIFISLALQGIKVPRPLTHDLLLSTIEAAGYLLKSARVVKVEEGVFYAQLELSKDAETVLVDCRPSDAVAVALRAQVPILAAEEVINEAGMEYPKNKLQPVPVSAGDGAIAMIYPDANIITTEFDNKIAKTLADMDPESKYKM